MYNNKNCASKILMISNIMATERLDKFFADLEAKRNQNSDEFDLDKECNLDVEDPKKDSTQLKYDEDEFYDTFEDFANSLCPLIDSGSLKCTSHQNNLPKKDDKVKFRTGQIKHHYCNRERNDDTLKACTAMVRDLREEVQKIQLENCINDLVEKCKAKEY